MNKVPATNERCRIRELKVLSGQPAVDLLFPAICENITGRLNSDRTTLLIIFRQSGPIAIQDQATRLGAQTCAK